MTLNMEHIFKRAARSSALLWGQEDDPEDLVQELWVWYLETPSTQSKMAGLSTSEAIKTARIRCNQLLSERILEGNLFKGKVLYSADSIREALHGLSNNTYLKNILPIAMERVQRKDDQREASGNPRGYAEALRKRYTDKLVPVRGTAEEKTLMRAVKALTDELNVLFLTSDVTGPGSRTNVFPDTRSPTGGHGDPTGDIAVLLVEHPEMRDEYLEVTPLEELLEGRSAQHIRRGIEWDSLLRDVSESGDAGTVPTPKEDVDRELERAGP